MAIFSSFGQMRSTAGPRVAGSSQAAASSSRPACSSGLSARDLGEQLVGAGDEHAGVPQVLAVGRGSRLAVSRSGFSTKLGHRLDVLGAVDLERRAALDVAEAHGGLGGRDADRRDVPGVGGGDRLGDRRPEQRLARDHVVGGERADDHARLAAFEDRRGEADGGRRVARLALEHDVGVGELGQLGLDRGAVGAPGDDHDALIARERGEPVPRVLEQGLPGSGQVVQELRRVGARERPEAGADAACGDHGVEPVERLVQMHPLRIAGDGERRPRAEVSTSRY